MAESGIINGLQQEALKGRGLSRAIKCIELSPALAVEVERF
jgi:hypothetical protein